MLPTQAISFLLGTWILFRSAHTLGSFRCRRHRAQSQSLSRVFAAIYLAPRSSSKSTTQHRTAVQYQAVPCNDSKIMIEIHRTLFVVKRTRLLDSCTQIQVQLFDNTTRPTKRSQSVYTTLWKRELALQLAMVLWW